MILIDYFTKFIAAKVLERKNAKSVLEKLKGWIGEGYIPEKMITDNGRKFSNEIMRKWIKEIGIEHRLVSVESHRSNGRVERVIRTIREGLLKVEGDGLKERLES